MWYNNSMLQGSFKKVDGLVRREKAPDLTAEKEADLALEQEIKPKIEKIGSVEPVIEVQPIAMPLPAEPVKPVLAVLTKERIEHILAEDLAGVYSELPRPLQAEFKAKGEAVAVKITQLLQKTRIKIREIINLIKQWLKTIPGINRFFLEQEAKIKADKIMALRLSAK
ncbi:MAG: hypothetical protein V1684_00790 [bacterium]